MELPGGGWGSGTFRMTRVVLAASAQSFPSSWARLASALSAELSDNCLCLLGSQLLHLGLPSFTTSSSSSSSLNFSFSE